LGLKDFVWLSSVKLLVSWFVPAQIEGRIRRDVDRTVSIALAGTMAEAMPKAPADLI
jgi:hypothetical protein